MNRAAARNAILGLLALAALLSCQNPIASDGTAGDPATRQAATPLSTPGGALELLLSGGDAKGHGFDRYIGGRQGRHQRHFSLGDRQVTSVWVTILSIEVHGQVSGWNTIFSDPQGAEYDLLEFVEDLEYLSSTQLAPDHYSQVRLVLGSGNRVTLDGTTDYPLMVPSGEQTGIKVVGGFFIKENTDTTVVLEFNAEKSVKPIGRGRFLLKPAIRIEEVSYEPRVSQNQPPSASFPPAGFQFVGSATDPANGYYVANGTFPSVNPQTKYTQMGGDYNLYSFYYQTDFYRYWAVNPSLIEVVPDLNALAYYFYDPIQMNLSQPPETSWAAGTGVTPAPGLLRMPISGTAARGNLLTVHYLFSDPDQDDYEGVTQFQWFKFDSASGSWAPLAFEATAFQYTPTSAGTYRVEVTPVDNHGLAGQTITSPSLVVGG